jgi:hypothetical protein
MKNSSVIHTKLMFDKNNLQTIGKLSRMESHQQNSLNYFYLRDPTTTRWLIRQSLTSAIKVSIIVNEIENQQITG